MIDPGGAGAGLGAALMLAVVVAAALLSNHWPKGPGTA